MILHGNDLDPAMRYEGLYRFAFDNCRKQEDPWGEASQSNYNFIFTKENFDEAKISLSRILHKLIFDNYKNNNALIEKLIEIEKKIILIKNQYDAILLIDETLNLLN